MFPRDSAFNEPEYELELPIKEEEVPQEDRSLHEAALHDLNELVFDLEGIDGLGEEEVQVLRERVENIRDTLYSTFSG